MIFWACWAKVLVPCYSENYVQKSKPKTNQLPGVTEQTSLRHFWLGFFKKTTKFQRSLPSVKMFSATSSQLRSKIRELWPLWSVSRQTTIKQAWEQRESEYIVEELLFSPFCFIQINKKIFLRNFKLHLIIKYQSRNSSRRFHRPPITLRVVTNSDNYKKVINKRR